MRHPEPCADWRTATAQLAARLTRTFDALPRWLAADPPPLERRPHPAAQRERVNRKWSTREICSHVTRVDHFLLILTRKIARTCRARADRGETWPIHPPRFEHLEALARRDFGWESPEHMLPDPDAQPGEIVAQLAADKAECLALLEAMPAGEGTLHRIRMSVVPQDDRLDLYQYLAVIELHARRHVRQLEESA